MIADQQPDPADRRVFTGEPEEYAEFQRILDAPPREDPALDRLLSRPSPFGEASSALAEPRPTPTIRATFTVKAEVTVDLDPVDYPDTVLDEDTAAELAHQQAQSYLDTLTGDGRGTTIQIDLDGIGADTVEEVPA